MVVPVLITSCQVFDQLNTGPDTAQKTMMPSARPKAQGRPAAIATLDAMRSKKWFIRSSPRAIVAERAGGFKAAGADET
jgi:hypothetical protein